uniref:Uncharacterized protein n=1 Tax=Acrobeloides nanus TaxID=290746 RepID=A0A914D606_9BILA
MSLLDALSRHSLQPLVTYASEEAEHQVGFVRELSAGEIDGFLQENAVLEKKKKSSIFIRSPLELNLIDQRILDLRLPNLETSLGKLQEFTETKLSEVLDSGKLVFVIFWSNVNSVSMHAFHLWAKASEMIDVDDDVILGFVSCHLQTDVCTAFGISHQDHHTIFAYRNRKKITTQVNLRDEEFYVEWIKMVKNHDPVNRLDSKEEFDQARKGILKGFPNVRQAVTIGTFNSEESKEFQS